MKVTRVQNQSRAETEWEVDGLKYTERIKQEYANCSFSAGEVAGHPVDTLYLRIEREGEHQLFLLLRPDEASAIIWCLSGAMWSEQVAEV
jgi:hypothetical protein